MTLGDNTEPHHDIDRKWQPALELEGRAREEEFSDGNFIAGNKGKSRLTSLHGDDGSWN